MMKNPRNLLWLIPVLLFVSGPLWKPALVSFLTPRGDFEASLPGSGEGESQNFIMDSITITLNSEGRKEWIIKAARAFTGRTDRELGMIGVDALYVGKDPKQPIRISSNRGTYYLDERHLILIDSVVVRKPATHEVLYTDLLHYYDQTKMVISPVDVEIVGKGFTIRAGRMDYDLSTDGYDFSNGVIVDI
ncbi:MAG TPA: LPS export ABC transporter periplasmic protein LptC [Desulfobulbus sp.]|nr:LPS export ABC transporter periplasmic protein LptC [Desulfobulbus sp.]